MGVEILEDDTKANEAKQQQGGGRAGEEAAKAAAGGVRVINIAKGGPAKAAGLRIDDIILSANGLSMNLTSDMGVLASRVKPGRLVRGPSVHVCVRVSPREPALPKTSCRTCARFRFPCAYFGMDPHPRSPPFIPFPPYKIIAIKGDMVFMLVERRVRKEVSTTQMTVYSRSKALTFDHFTRLRRMMTGEFLVRYGTV